MHTTFTPYGFGFAFGRLMPKAKPPNFRGLLYYSGDDAMNLSSPYTKARVLPLSQFT